MLQIVFVCFGFGYVVLSVTVD